MTKATIEIALATPFEYHYQGQKIMAETLVVKAPFNNVKQWTAKLKQMFFRAVKYHEKNSEASTRPAQEEKSELKAREILSMMFMSDVDMVDFSATMQKLLTTPGVCLVDGKENLTATLYEKMSDEDSDLLSGEYLANFIISSLMKDLNAK